jgi:hypothetical protein
MAGDVISDVVFDHFYMPQQAMCFDFGFLRRVTFSNVKAQGAADNGSPGSQATCITNIYDVPFAENYPGALTFSTSYDITVDATNDFSGFAVGTKFSAGSRYYFAAYSHDNSGVNSLWGLGAGLYIDDEAGSQKDPVTDVNISGATFYNNGTSAAGGGVVIDGRNQQASELIRNISIGNSVFDNNTNKAVETLGTHVAPNSVVIGANLLSGANQTTTYDAVTLALLGAGTVSTQIAGSCGQFQPETALTQYCVPGKLSTGELGIPATKGALFSTLRVGVDTPPGAGHTYTFTWRIGSSTAITCTISGARATTCSDTTHSVAIAASAGYDLQIVADAPGAANTNVQWSIEQRAP